MGVNAVYFMFNLKIISLGPGVVPAKIMLGGV